MNLTYSLLEASMFGTKHIVILSICILAIVGISILLRKAKLTTWYKLLLFVGITSETLKVITYVMINEKTYGGYLPKTDLPFQLCSIQLIFIAILNFSKSEKVKRFLMAFMIPTCLIGGFAALLIPTSSSLNVTSITIQYYLYHVAIISFAIYLISNKELKWTVKDLANTLKFLALIGLIAIYLNSMFYDVTAFEKVGDTTNVEMLSRVNFMYVVDPPVSGLPFLNKDHGWLVYIVHYACLAVACVSLCYIKPIIVAIKSKFTKKQLAEGSVEEPTETEDKEEKTA